MQEHRDPGGVVHNPHAVDHRADRQHAVLDLFQCFTGGQEDVVGGGKQLTNRRKLIDVGLGTPDGMRCDVDGNLWMGWGMGDATVDGVNIYNPDGRLIGRINLPERCANLCFGGTYRNRLFMAASKSVYSLYVNTQGARGG